MNWSRMVIDNINIRDKEILCAWLHFAGVDSIVENVLDIEAYFLTAKQTEIVQVLLEKVPELRYSIFEVPNQNWNALWESSFSPIHIDDIYIRASFHPKIKDLTEIVISPKMAFGTGHHETTSMMISYLQSQNLSGKNILDYGCGTGILCIMSFLKGASKVVGIDIQLEAIENTLEHLEINLMKDRNYTILQGDLDVLTLLNYDVIIANINRNILSLNHNKLYNLLDKKGTLLISGIMQMDRELIVNLYEETGFTLIEERTKGEWCLFIFNK